MKLWGMLIEDYVLKGRLILVDLKESKVKKS